MNALWPILAVGAAALQVVRNAAQRRLTEQLGLWGATFVRFAFGLPFALIWAGGILAWRGCSGGPSTMFAAWVLLGACAQSAAMACLVLAMRGRAFAVATALSKTEVLASALVGVWLIHDVITPGAWLGAALGTAGVVAMAHVSVDRAQFRAALAGAGAGLLFSVSGVAYRAGAHAWGGDQWVGAAAVLASTLAAQTIGGLALLGMFARPTLRALVAAWRPSLVPGAAGALSSALLFTAFSIGPSAGAVKTVQLVDVIIAWVVSRRLFGENTRLAEILGAALVLAGALAALLA